MNINFEWYKVFFYVGKYLSFSKAAKHLYISQSAVSQSIKLLEDKLGCPLLLRHTKKVDFTKEGALLFQHIEQAFHFIKSGERSLEQIHTLKDGEVKIGASDTICKYYLLPYFKKFHELFPRIKIHVINRPSPVCMDLLSKGSVDLSIVNLFSNDLMDPFTLHKSKEIQDVFVGGKEFNSLKKQPLSIEKLSQYPFLSLPHNASTTRFLESFSKKYHVTFHPEFELGSVDLLIELTKIGLGLSFVMKDIIYKDLQEDNLFIIPLKERIPKRKIGVISHKKIPLSMAAQKFIDLVFKP